jgi:hypothetical protein
MKAGLTKNNLGEFLKTAINPSARRVSHAPDRMWSTHTTALHRRQCDRPLLRWLMTLYIVLKCTSDCAQLIGVSSQFQKNSAKGLHENCLAVPPESAPIGPGNRLRHRHGGCDAYQSHRRLQHTTVNEHEYEKAHPQRNSNKHNCTVVLLEQHGRIIVCLMRLRAFSYGRHLGSCRDLGRTPNIRRGHRVAGGVEMLLDAILFGERRPRAPKLAGRHEAQDKRQDAHQAACCLWHTALQRLHQGHAAESCGQKTTSSGRLSRLG